MATRASESKFDRNRSLAAGADTVAASEVADQEGLSMFISVRLFDKLILTICLQGLGMVLYARQRRQPGQKKVSNKNSIQYLT